MIDYIGDTLGNVRLPGIMMLGYVAAHSENLAMAVIVSKVNHIVLPVHVHVYASMYMHILCACRLYVCIYSKCAYMYV